MGFITKAGTWFTYGEMRLGQGRENARKFLDDNPELLAELETKIRNACEVDANTGTEEAAGALAE